MLRITSFFCGLAACGLFAWVGYMHFRAEVPTGTISQDGEIERDQPDVLMLENSDQDLGEIPLGDHSVSFLLVNRSIRDTELIGNETKCISGCCFGIESSVRARLRAGESLELQGKLHLGKAGKFEYGGRIFVNDGVRLRSVSFKLKGVGVSAENMHAPPP